MPGARRGRGWEKGKHCPSLQTGLCWGHPSRPGQSVCKSLVAFTSCWRWAWRWPEVRPSVCSEHFSEHAPCLGLSILRDTWVPRRLISPGNTFPTSPLVFAALGLSRCPPRQLGPTSPGVSQGRLPPGRVPGRGNHGDHLVSGLQAAPRQSRTDTHLGNCSAGSWARGQGSALVMRAAGPRLGGAGSVRGLRLGGPGQGVGGQAERPQGFPVVWLPPGRCCLGAVTSGCFLVLPIPAGTVRPGTRSLSPPVRT